LKTTYISLIFLSFVILTIPSVNSADFDDPVMQAMNDELDRSMNELILEDMIPPYFLSYLIRDGQSLSITSRYGSLIKSSCNKSRFLSIDLRVGSPEQDNTNFFPDWRAVWNYKEDLIEENDYDPLRHQLWRHTDKAYKTALETIARKKAYLQANPPKYSIPDFAPVEPYQLLEKPVELADEKAVWKKRINAAAAAFEDYHDLQDWQIEFTAQASTNRYLNSEDSHHRIGKITRLIEVTATIQAEDGERLTGSLQYLIPNTEKPPTVESLIQDVKTLASQLESAAMAPTLDEYVGPVLFEDQAAAQFVSMLFVNQLSLIRKPLTPSEWMSQYIPVGKLAERIKRRVFPDFVTVTDEPLREKWNKTSLTGYMVVDAEGVPSQNITLVKDGWLKTIPLGRQPARKISGSNGHARSLPVQLNVPGISNLIVTTSKPLKEKKMLSKLRKISREYGNEFGLIVKQLDVPYLTQHYQTIEDDSESEKLLQHPVIAYKVYVDDGRLEPVRGLVFDEVTIRSLRDIGAMGKDSHAYNLTQTTIFSDFRYAASIVTPSILVEEMELKESTLQEPLPVTFNPIFE